MIDLRSLDIPLPFEAHINPYVSIAEDRVRHWARRTQLAVTPGATQRLDRARFGLGAACVYPTASPADLAICAAWLAWLLAADDQHAGGADGSIEVWRAERARLTDVLRGESEPASPICRSLADLRHRTFTHMPVSWQFRFTSHIQEAFDGYDMESVQLRRGEPAVPEEYVGIRRYSGSVPFCIDLAEFVARAQVPEPIYCLPAFQEILLATNDVISWVNDIYSVNKEIAQEDPSNYVISLSYHWQLTLEQALHEVIDRTVQRAADFIKAEWDLREQLDELHLPIEAQDAAWKNVAGMRDWMAGQIHWYQNTDRYSTFTPPSSAALRDGAMTRKIERQSLTRAT